MRRVLITGANRGLGLEFVRSYLTRGDRVFAGARAAAENGLTELGERHPHQLTVVRLDVSDPDSIRDSHAAVREQVSALDVLVNNAGVYSVQGSANPTERLGTLDFLDALNVMRTNAIGPLIVAQQYLDLLESAHHAKVVNISSGYGSVSTNTGGFPYYYAGSKAALNQFSRSYAVQAARHGIITVVMDPGWMQTDMGDPYAPMSPRDVAESAIDLIDALTPRDNNRFLAWDGTEQSW